MIASAMRHAAMAIVLSGCLVASACVGDDSRLPTFDDPVKGDRVDPESFVDALRASFRSGSTARVSLEVQGGAGLTGSGSVRYRADSMDSSLRIDDWQVEGASIDILTIGGTTFMRVPESRGLWVDLSEGETGVPGADLADEADPRRAIGELRNSIDEIRYGGTETVGGVRARRFQVVTEPTGEQGSGSDGTDHRTVTQYWFDSRGRVVRRQTALVQAGSLTFSWAKWGQPVKIVRPKADAVVTLERLDQLRKRQAGPSQ